MNLYCLGPKPAWRPDRAENLRSHRDWRWHGVIVGAKLRFAMKLACHQCRPVGRIAQKICAPTGAAVGMGEVGAHGLALRFIARWRGWHAGEESYPVCYPKDNLREGREQPYGAQQDHPVGQ